ncbi:hypothetical protein niasHS_002743 [Heterodera schachtii]|uniref:C2H2-type domain-containing protein n=1 Tax=Heterodera schachtii TaxID=97005 RepID=A0ABD2K2B4_HETSC
MDLPIDIRPTESQLLLAVGTSSSKSAPPICTFCCKAFKNRGSMYFHMKKRHGTDFGGAGEENIGTLDAIFGITATANGAAAAVRFHCPVDGCRRRGEGTRGTHFASAKLLVQHFQKTHTEKRHRCSECSARFALARDLRYHQKKLCPSAKCAEKSVPISNSRLSPLPKGPTNGCCCPPKVFLVPINLGQSVRFRHILPRFPIGGRRTVATQTDECQRTGGGRQRQQKCRSVASQIDAQFGLGSSSANFYANYDSSNAALSPAVFEFHHQMQENQQCLTNEFLLAQSVQCQTNFQQKTNAGIEFGAQCSAVPPLPPVTPSARFSSLSSHIYLPPLLTSSSTQTAAQMQQNQCSQTMAEPSNNRNEHSGQSNSVCLLLQSQNTAATQTYYPPPTDHQQLLLAHEGIDSEFCWMDEAALCASVSAQTDLSWTARVPTNEWLNIGEIGQRYDNDAEVD